MPPDLSSLSVAEQIDQFCDRFESAWKAEQNPRIEAILDTAPVALRPQLLLSLLEIELEILQARGGRPAPDTYRERFSRDLDVVNAAFRQLAENGNARRAAQISAAVTISQASPAIDTSYADIPGLSAAIPEVPQIGRFTVKAILGSGAFGAVYRGHDPQLDRDVAIKVPRADTLITPEDKQRFLREARAAATLNHPQVCPVYEVGEVDGRPYIVMALVEGKTLAEVLKGKPANERQVATAIRKIALGLEEAHRQQIVHRDLKPANIMINRRGEPVVMDFGLARHALKGDEQLTMSGTILGTPAYMSPEQARGDGKLLGPATDIYSLGVILYESLAGRRPFVGTFTEVLGKILHVPAAPPSEFRSGIDPRLEAICLKAIAKSPADRYASMAAFAGALADFLKDNPAKVPEPVPVPSDAPTPIPSALLPSSLLPPSLLPTPLPPRPAVARPIPPPLIPAPRVPAPVATLPTVVVAAGSTQVIRDPTAIRTSPRRRQKFPLWLGLIGAGCGGALLLLGIQFFTHTPPATAPTKPAPTKTEIGSQEDAGAKPVPAPATPTPTVPVRADGFVDLFNGKDLTGWQERTGGTAKWNVVDGYMEVVGPDIATTRKFGSDFELHVEFWIAKSTGKGQKRGNSGVYLQGRHEIQIMDGYENPESPTVSCGALFGKIGPIQNVCRPPEQWQTFDITYHSPRKAADGDLSPGRLTVVHNGIKVIDDATFTAVTGALGLDDKIGEPGPIMLQNHGSKVRFRNIRIRELNVLPADGKTFGGHWYKFFREQVTWKEAQAKCAALGGHLVIIESIEENQFVGGMVDAANWKDSWIGITDEALEGLWVDVAGKPLKFRNWLVGQPNNKSKEEHYAVMTNRSFGEAANWRWCDQPNKSLPSNEPGYVCEWDSAGPAPK